MEKMITKINPVSDMSVISSQCQESAKQGCDAISLMCQRGSSIQGYGMRQQGIAVIQVRENKDDD